ncbi:hypothetical protein PVK06_019281 [Gossypium arboreum]|uniref:Uncharacterized protein n=1 Tax=Gossypium arboreum TaxID=29729 RepID=A0ABR0PJ94_GOSAR|nr:hypothetical protein PVK06_019281 [Gossypium arboreum]
MEKTHKVIVENFDYRLREFIFQHKVYRVKNNKQLKWLQKIKMYCSHIIDEVEDLLLELLKNVEEISMHASSKLQIRVAKHNLKLESLKRRHSREIEELKHEIVAQEIEILKHEIDALEIEFGEKKSKLLKLEVERMQMVEALNAVNREIEKDLHHEKKTHKVITEDFDS